MTDLCWTLRQRVGWTAFLFAGLVLSGRCKDRNTFLAWKRLKSSDNSRVDVASG